MPPLLLAANGPDSLIWWEWVADHAAEIARLTAQHVVMTVVAVVAGVLLALPLTLLGVRVPRSRGVVLGVSSVLYTIPSVAMLFMLGPLTGFTTLLTVEVMLTLYTLLVIVRNNLTGLDGVGTDVLEAARGMGYTPGEVLRRVQVPLAMPTILAGIRIATVTTVGLVTVGALIGQGALGDLILDGINRQFPTPLVVGSALSILLAVLADVGLQRSERVLIPWHAKAPVAGVELVDLAAAGDGGSSSR